MTVNISTTRIAYACDGILTEFEFPFKIIENADILAIKSVDDTGVETTLTLDIDYEITISETADGGVLTLLDAATCPDGTTLTILRDVDILQETDFVDGDNFSAEAYEAAIDKNTTILQQFDDDLKRAIRFPLSTSNTSSRIDPAEFLNRALKILGFNSLGEFGLLPQTVASARLADGAYVDIADYSYDLTALVAALGATVTDVLIDGEATCSGATVVPSNLRLLPTIKATINQGSYALTINSPYLVFSESTQAIFTGTGTVDGLKYVRPEWFSTGIVGAVKSGANIIHLQNDAEYTFTATKSATLGTYSSYQGFSMIGAGIITDDQTYAGADVSAFISFVGSNNIYIDPRIKFSTQASDNVNQIGMTWFKFTEGCDGISGGGEFDGGLHGFYFQQNSPISAANVSKNIDLDIRAANLYYAYLAERSGDNANVRINADTCGRDIFLFGGGNNTKAVVKSKNQFGASLVSSASGGEGVSDVKIDFISLDNDFTGTSESWYVGLQFFNETPATFKNIEFNLNIVNPATRTNKDTFLIAKYDNSSSADTTGRGHVIDGLKVSGYSNTVDTCNHIDMIGEFASADEIYGLTIGPLHGASETAGGSRINLTLGDALQDIARVEDVYDTNTVIAITHSTGMTVFHRCTAQDLTDDLADTSPQEYNSCNIVNGDLQSRTNKLLDKTYIGSQLFSVTNGFSANTGTMAIDGVYDLSINGIAEQQGFVLFTRGGGGSAIFQLNGANHTTTEVLDPNTEFTDTKDSAVSFNVYWETDHYELQNKTGSEETAGIELTYFTRMD